MEYSNTNEKILNESLKEEIKSVVLEKRNFQMQVEPTIKQFWDFGFTLRIEIISFSN